MSASGVGVPIDASTKGRLVRRYKRFLADVELEDEQVVTVHCPNPGSMLGLQAPGSSVRCSTSDDPRRKLRHTLEMIRVGRVWVGLHTQRANQLAARALARSAVPGLDGYAELRAEVPVAQSATAGSAGRRKKPGGKPAPKEDRSRLDFLLTGHAGDPRPAWVEVKSVTLRGEGAARRRGLFPDAVTARGRRHMETLARLRGEGARAVLLFVVQRADCSEVRPADEIDPAYGEALRAAVGQGVEVFALQARVTARRISMEGMLPVVL